jgi:hypothetical protein
MSDAGQPPRERVRAFLRGRGATKWLIFAFILLALIAWVATAGDEHSALARSFLRSLARLLR